jgi:hypothetical protein
VHQLVNKGLRYYQDAARYSCENCEKKCRPIETLVTPTHYIHNCTVYVFSMLFSSYVSRLCRYLQGAYTEISLKRIAVNNLL